MEVLFQNRKIGDGKRTAGKSVGWLEMMRIGKYTDGSLRDAIKVIKNRIAGRGFPIRIKPDTTNFYIMIVDE